MEIVLIILCVFTVYFEKKIFKRIESKEKAKGRTNYNFHYSGYIILNTVLIFSLIIMWLFLNK